GLGQPEPQELIGQALQAPGRHTREEQLADDLVDVGMALIEIQQSSGRYLAAVETCDVQGPRHRWFAHRPIKTTSGALFERTLRSLAPLGMIAVFIPGRRVQWFGVP